MKITIVGGGNIGTQFAVHFSQKNDVIIYTSNPSLFIENIELVDENNKVLMTGKNIKATNDEKEAFSNADIIFVTYPAFEMKRIADIICPYVKKNLKIGLIPGTGGGECAFKNCIEKGAVVFGLQRVPSVARIIEKGKKVRVVGYRDELYLASLPKIYSEQLSKLIGNVFNIKCISLPNYLNVTLTPSNPILHTTRLKTIFKDYYDGFVYKSIPLFYEDWNNETSELLFKCDDEVQNICNEIKEFDLNSVKSLKVHYESTNIQELTDKIKSITGFKGLTTPAIKIEDGYIPDFSSRYFSADFPYGLAILIQIGEIFNVNVKNMKETMDWYIRVSNNKKEFNYKMYGINDKNDFLDFYSK